MNIGLVDWGICLSTGDTYIWKRGDAVEDMEILKRIIEIDSRSSDIGEKTKKIIEENERNMKVEIDKMEEDIIEKGKADGKMEMEKLILEGEWESDEIEKQFEEREKRLELKFSELKKDIEQEIFSRIFEKGEI